MVKKCLITIAVVALLATTVQAVDNPYKLDGGWPFHWTVEYDELAICTFPVKLEVGYYVQVKNCGDLSIKLSQVNCNTLEADDAEDDDFPCYAGCVWDDEEEQYGFLARANFAAVFGADFDATNREEDMDDIIGDKWDINFGPSDDNEIVGNGSYQLLKLCMEAWKVQLWKSGDTDGKVQVGEITILVKPPLDNEEGDESNWPSSKP